MVAHLTEGDVVDVYPSSNLDLKLGEEDAELLRAHQPYQLQFTQNTLKLQNYYRVSC